MGKNDYFGEKQNLCKCGCGQHVHKDYARGHCHRVNKEMFTEEWREKVSRRSKENNPNIGRKHSEETKRKISERRTGRTWAKAERDTHLARFEKQRQEKEAQRKPCSCGCGEFAKYGKKYIAGHHHRNRSEEVRKNMSDGHKGQVAWCKGKTHLDDTRILSGERHGMWNGGTKQLNKIIRDCPKYKQWRDEVFERDLYTCQRCGIHGARLHAHHLTQFAEILSIYQVETLGQALKNPALWDIDNGKTYCKDCHGIIHQQEEIECRLV